MPQIALYVNNGMVADRCHYETFTPLYVSLCRTFLLQILTSSYLTGKFCGLKACLVAAMPRCTLCGLCEIFI